jgi:hypothetical protein
MSATVRSTHSIRIPKRYRDSRSSEWKSEHENLQNHDSAPAPALAESEAANENKTPAAARDAEFRSQGRACPECGSAMMKESGCWVCMSCGWSKCG